MDSAKEIRTSTSKRIAELVLLFAVLAGAFFRWYGVRWDNLQSFHPDERNILGASASLERSTFYRVGFFSYGQFPAYLYRLTAAAITPPDVLVLAAGDMQQKSLYFIYFGLLFSAAALLLLLSRRTSPQVFSTALLAGFSAVYAFSFHDVASQWGAALLRYGYSERPAAALLAIVILLAVLWHVTALSQKSSLARTCFALTLVFFVAAALPRAAGGGWFSYDGLMLIGRCWSGLFSTATILAVYFLSKELYGRHEAGLLAAVFLSCSVLSIQISHFCTTESFLGLMLVLVALASYRLSHTGSWTAYLSCGLLCGLALSAKTSAIYYPLMLVTGHLTFVCGLSRRALPQGTRSGLTEGLQGTGIIAAVCLCAGVVCYGARGRILDLFLDNPARGNAIWLLATALACGVTLYFLWWALTNFSVLCRQAPWWRRLASSMATCLLFFFVFSPWSVFDRQSFATAMRYEWEVVAFGDAAYVLQFKDTPRYLYQLYNLAAVGIGWPLGLAAYLGVLAATAVLLHAIYHWAKLRLPAASLCQVLRRHGILLAWLGPYFIFVGAWNVKFMRYLLPLIPFLCVFAAGLLSNIRWPRDLLRGRALRIANTFAMLFVALPTVFYATAYTSVYRSLHPWFEASSFIYRTIPHGAKIYKEHWDDGLPVPSGPKVDPRLSGPEEPGSYVMQEITSYEMHGHPTDDSPEKKDHFIRVVEEADYIVIASKKLWYSLSDFTPAIRPQGFNRYPVTSRFYRLLWSGQLGLELIADFASYPSLLGWTLKDDAYEESFSVYDHPHVYIFKKMRRVNADRIREMLSTDIYVQSLKRAQMLRLTCSGICPDILEQSR